MKVVFLKGSFPLSCSTGLRTPTSIIQFFLFCSYLSQKAAPVATSFDPLAMDDLIMTSGSVSGGTAHAPSVQKRVKVEEKASQDKTKKQLIEEERRRAEQRLLKQIMRAKVDATAPKEG